MVGIGRRDASQSSVIITRASFVIHPSRACADFEQMLEKSECSFYLLKRTILDRGYVKVEIIRRIRGVVRVKD